MIGYVCIKVDITPHLTHMGWNAKCNKSILEILNDNIYFKEKRQDWYVDNCVHHLDNKCKVRTHLRPIDNMQEAATSDTENNRQAYYQKMPIGFDIFNKYFIYANRCKVSCCPL